MILKRPPKNKQKSQLILTLSRDVHEKLKEVADDSGEDEKTKAVSYISTGVSKDYADLKE